MDTKTDKITLRRVGLKKDQLLLVDQPERPSISHVQPSNLFSRLQSFIPEIAAANEGLSTEEHGIDAEVVKVLPAEGCSDSDSDSDDDSVCDDDNQLLMKPQLNCSDSTKVEIKIDLFRSSELLDSSDISVHDVKSLPDGFAEANEEAENHGSPKKLIEIL